MSYCLHSRLYTFCRVLACFVLVGGCSKPLAAQVPVDEMSTKVLMTEIQIKGVGATIDLVLELVKRLENDKAPTPEIRQMVARVYFEVSLYYFNQFVESGLETDLAECVTYGEKLRSNFPEDSMAKDTLQFEIDGYMSLRAWEDARDALKLALDGVESGLYPKDRQPQWLAKACLVYSIIKEWEEGEPYFIQQYNSLQTSLEERTLAAIYLIRTYEDVEEPEKALPYVSVLSVAKDDRWDPELNLSLFKLGNQFSDEGEYTKANYLYFLCLSLEDITGFYEEKIRSLRNRIEWYRSRESPVTIELNAEVDSLVAYVAALREQNSYAAPLKYARARNLERMGRSYDSFFAYLRLVREHPDHSYGERYHFTAFNQSIEIGYSDYSVELGETYLARSDYDTYWREVSVKLMMLYFELEQYDRVLELGATFMSKDPTHEYGANVVHFMAFSLMREDELVQLRETVGLYLDAHPTAALAESAHYWLGLTDVVEQDFEAGIPHFDYVIEHYSNGTFYVESRFRRGVCEFGLGDYEAAKRIFTEWVDTYPTNHLRGEAEGFLGDIYAFEADVEVALKHYKAVDAYTQRMSLVDHAYFESARLLEQNERYEEMVARLDTYMSKYQDDGNLARAIFRIGQAYENLGQPEIMLESYFAAIVRYGNNPLAEGVDEIFVRFAEKYYKFKSLFESTTEFIERMLNDEAFRLEMMADRKTLHLYRMEHPQLDRDVVDMLLRDENLRLSLSSRTLPQTKAQIELGEPPVVDNSILPDGRNYLNEQLAYFSARLAEYPSVSPEERFRELYDMAASNGQRTLELRLLVAFEELGITAPGNVQLELTDLSAASPATLGWIARQQMTINPALAERAARMILSEYPDSLAVPDAHIVLAELMISRGDLAAGLEIFDFVGENFPTWPKSADTAIRAGNLCFDAGNYDAALERYLYVLQVRDWRGEAWARACLNIGKCYEQKGEDMKAHGFYERTYLTYRQFPIWAGAAMYLDARLLETLNEIPSATNLYNQYLELPQVETLSEYNEVKQRLGNL